MKDLSKVSVQQVEIGANDISVVYFRIKATSFGMQKLKVTALGEKMSDAIQREIRVYPDGKSIEATQSNWLKDGAQQVIDIPAPAIAGATRLGGARRVLEGSGLDEGLPDRRAPGKCRSSFRNAERSGLYRRHHPGPHAGPRSSPVVGGGKVVTLGVTGTGGALTLSFERRAFGQAIEDALNPRLRVAHLSIKSWRFRGDA